MTIREQLIDYALTRAPISVEFVREGERCVVIGRVAFVDLRNCCILIGDGGEQYTVRLEQVERAERMAA